MLLFTLEVLLFLFKGKCFLLISNMVIITGGESFFLRCLLVSARKFVAVHLTNQYEEFHFITFES